MISISSFKISPQENYLDSLWTREECYRFYVRQRRKYCSYLEILDLWLQAPYCESCSQSDFNEQYREPDIASDNWELDVLIHMGNATLKKIKENLRINSDFVFMCKSCGYELKPWDDDQIYVVTYHLEEHYGIPLETGDKRNPSKKLRKKILNLYNRECFCCGSSEKELHIDHILPQASGGDAAFRNLQPLCTECGSLKTDHKPAEVRIFSDIYFGTYPIDLYEGLFW